MLHAAEEGSSGSSRQVGCPDRGICLDLNPSCTQIDHIQLKTFGFLTVCQNWSFSWLPYWLVAFSSSIYGYNVNCSLLSNLAWQDTYLQHQWGVGGATVQKTTAVPLTCWCLWDELNRTSSALSNPPVNANDPHTFTFFLSPLYFPVYVSVVISHLLCKPA